MNFLPRRRVPEGSDNPLVAAIGRLPLPIRVKQLAGSLVVAGLLAFVAVLGLVALGQSNSRGTELRRLKQRGAYEQVLLTDTQNLKQLVQFRLYRYTDLLHAPTAYRRGYWAALDLQVEQAYTRLCIDANAQSFPQIIADQHEPGLLPRKSIRGRSASLASIAPALAQQLQGIDLPIHGRNPPSLFDTIGESAGGLNGPNKFVPLGIEFYLHRGARWAASFARSLAALSTKTQARANALVAGDRGAYRRSRDLLIAAGAGSFLLALGLGLLLSDSVLVPLRKTQRHLAMVAAGDFSRHLTVQNRDEIGALAADVNRMSAELQRLYQELETASRHKSDFLATMSHELRTPLNAIIGFSEVLQEQMFGELNDRQRGYVEDILEAGKHLLSLINDVLDLSKIEAGKMELDFSQVPISDVLRSAVAMHAERATRRGIQLSLTLEPEEIKVRGDGRRIRQIVFNLVSNAVKFTPAAGRIDVSARLNGERVEVAVADTGSGIAPEELEMIFKEFEQARDGKLAEGSGLGLPLSRKLVELHGGRLWVESAPGRGSTFRFTLPLISASSRPPATKPEVARLLGRSR
jgi:signal transduction histidine kinase